MVDDSPAPPLEAVASAGRGLRGRTDCKVRGGAVVSKRKGGGRLAFRTGIRADR